MTAELRATLNRLNLPALLTGRFVLKATAQLHARQMQVADEGDVLALEVCAVLANVANMHLRGE